MFRDDRIFLPFRSTTPACCLFDRVFEPVAFKGIAFKLCAVAFGLVVSVSIQIGLSGTSASAADPFQHWLQLDTTLSRSLLDFQNRQTDKELLILQHQASREPYTGNCADGGCSSPQVFVGAQARLSLLAAATNSDGRFPYLGRFPTDFTGDTATDARILQANAQGTAHITPYASGFTELLFSDVFSFGDFKQGSLQVRQAYAVFGDLHRTPWYLYLGKKNIGFGDLSTLSPFTQSVAWHYFAGLAEGVGIGYHDDAMSLSMAAINGGRGIRKADSPERGKLNNLAFNSTFHWDAFHAAQFRFGGGFLLGTIYDASTAEHLNADLFGDDYNSAWDLNARLEWSAFTISGEFISTVDNWPVTGAPVSAWTAEAAYAFDHGPNGSFVSVSFSSGRQGPSGSEFEFNNQLVLGYGRRWDSHSFLSLEYVRSMGFAPLMNITTVSDRDVAQDSLVLGFNLTI